MIGPGVLSRLFRTLACLAVCIVAGCGTDRLADGGNGSETTNGLTARVLLPDGHPAAGVIITLRPAGFLKGDGLASPEGFPRIYADTTTDSLGYFTFRNLKTGDYVIEAREDSTYGLTSRVALSASVPMTNLNDLSLGRMGKVSGRVDRGPLGDDLQVDVLVYGIDRASRCDSNGTFRLSLPPGPYSLRIVASDSGAGSLEIPQVTCLPGVETRLSDQSLPYGYRLDSLAVHVFLDEAGLSKSAWSEIVGIQDNRIRSLNLRDRGLAILPESIGKLGFLHSLYLDGNPLAGLPDALDSLTILKTLTLERIPLDSLPAIVPRLSTLRHLHLGKTGLKDLPSGLTRLSDLENLSLDSNGMTRVPDVVSRLNGLLHLDVSWNALKSLPSDIGGLTRLQTLHVNDNLLDSLPESLGLLKELTRLWAYHNRIPALPSILGGMASLEILHLESNLLDSLPHGFGGLKGLKLLALGGNRLTELPASIMDLSPVDGLSLWNNRLCSVPADMKVWIGKYDFERYGGRSGPIWAELQLECPPHPGPP